MAKPMPMRTATSVASGLSGYWPSQIRDIGHIITVAAEAVRLDPDLIAAVVKKETWFNPVLYPQGLQACPDGPCTGSCTSRRGAQGPMQVMPYHFGGGERGRDLRTNIEMGSRILRDYIDRKGGTRQGLAAYYCGPNRSQYTSDCWAYADSILSWYKEANDTK